MPEEFTLRCVLSSLIQEPNALTGKMRPYLGLEEGANTERGPVADRQGGQGHPSGISGARVRIKGEEVIASFQNQR